MTDISDTDTENVAEKGTSNIRHLVMSSGVIYGFTFFGILKKMHETGKINLFDLQSIHATSVGSVIGTMMALWTISPTLDASGEKIFEWDILENYMVHRPWQHVFQFSLQNMINCYQKCGIFQKEIIKEILDSLFRSKDLDIATITMQEFFDLTHIEMFFFTVELHQFKIVNISHKTHPNWRVLDAIYASSCAPILFTPHENDSIKYTDGGFLVHYPMNYCLQWCDEHEYARDTVFGIHLLSQGIGSLQQEDRSASEQARTPNASRNGSEAGVSVSYSKGRRRSPEEYGMNAETSSVMPPKTESKKFTLLDYFYILTKHFYQIYSQFTEAGTSYSDQEIRPYEINVYPTLHAMDVITVVRSHEERQKLIEYGYSLFMKSSKF
jgi:predicted acylesterase/phospholipase RssA